MSQRKRCKAQWRSLGKRMTCATNFTNQLLICKLPTKAPLAKHSTPQSFKKRLSRRLSRFKSTSRECKTPKLPKKRKRRRSRKNPRMSQKVKKLRKKSPRLKLTRTFHRPSSGKVSRIWLFMSHSAQWPTGIKPAKLRKKTLKDSCLRKLSSKRQRFSIKWTQCKSVRQFCLNLITWGGSQIR